MKIGKKAETLEAVYIYIYIIFIKNKKWNQQKRNKE